MGLLVAAGSACATMHPGEPSEHLEEPPGAEVSADECAIYEAALATVRRTFEVPAGVALGLQSMTEARVDCRVAQDAKDCGEGEAEGRHRVRSLRGCRFPSSLGVVMLERERALQILSQEGCGSPRACLAAAGISSGQLVALGRAFVSSPTEALVEVVSAEGGALQLQLGRGLDGRWQVTEKTDVPTPPRSSAPEE